MSAPQALKVAPQAGDSSDDLRAAQTLRITEIFRSLQGEARATGLPTCFVRLTGCPLRCHYCDYRIPPPEHCTSCGAPDTALLGLGTQRLEEEMHRAVAEAMHAFAQGKGKGKTWKGKGKQ